MELQEGICILCLEKCDDFETIDGNAENALDLLLLKIDFTLIRESVMCKNCSELLINCFDFKVTCLTTQDLIFSFVNKKNSGKLDLKDIYLIKDVTGTGVVHDEDVCGFCMGLVKKCFTLSLDAEEGDALLKRMVEQCLPELDLNIIKKPVICGPCHESLENCFRFLTNYLIVQEKIKEYRETLHIDPYSQIALSSLLQFIMSGLTTSGNSVNVIEAEKHLWEDGKYSDENDIGNVDDIIRLERMLLDDNEDVSKDVGNKNKSFTDIDVQKVNVDEHQVTPKNMLVCEGESNKLGSSKKEEIFFENNGARQEEENVLNMEIQEFLLLGTRGFSRFEEGVALPRPEVSAKFSENRKSVTSNRKKGVSKSHIKQSLVNKNVSKEKKEKVHHCEQCSFQTKYKNHLKSHLLVHKNLSNVTIYKCDFCSFHSKYSRCFKKHLLVHKDLSEATVYKCDACSFQTKHKKSFDRHLTVDPLIATIYKCDYCSFQTKYKFCLKNHLLLHKVPPKVTTYKCTSCLFQTNYVDSIKKHLLSHAPEIKIYKCDSCSYQTKRENDFKTHSLKHKDPSYKCGVCPFRTRDKDILRAHLLKQKYPSDVTIYKCKLCPFQSKMNYDTKLHKLMHKKDAAM